MEPTPPADPLAPPASADRAATTATDEREVTDSPDDSGPASAVDGDEPEPGTPAWWRSPWALAAAIGLVVVALTAIALVTTTRSSDRARVDLADAQSASVETQADLDQAQQDLKAQRAQLATVLDQAKTVGDQLDGQTAQRDDAAAKVEAARSELTTLSGLLNSQKGKLYAQARHMADLADCINGANRALNFMSFGDRDAGTKLLQESSKQCAAVNDYLASLDQQP